MNQTLQPSIPLPKEQLASPQKIVIEFLSQFASRQTWLQSLRGCCLGVIALLLGGVAIAAIDATSLLNDNWRWTLTCAAYAMSTVVGWMGGVKRWFHPSSAEHTAWEIENAHPKFRESLLSSVELRSPDGSVRSGSPEFLVAIEQNVAQELSVLDVDSMLPWQSVRSKVIGVIGVIAAILGLCCIPGLRFSERFARAMVPFVSLAKPSSIQFTIVEPSPSSPLVPSDQLIQFTVDVTVGEYLRDSHLTGGKPLDAFLELVEVGAPISGESSSQDARSSHRNLKMNLESESPYRFSLTAPIGNRKTQYRISAGDGQSIFRTITPVARPKPLAFHVTIQPPEYSQEASIHLTQPKGDLRVLKGSHVQLQVDINQSLSQADLILEFADSGRKSPLKLVKTNPSQELPLVANATTRYATEWDVTENARYQLRLISEFEYQGHKIENSFSPFYKVEAIEDTPATVQWVANEKTFWAEAPKPNATFIVSADDILTIAALVSDNLPVESISQEISINRGEWLTNRPNISLERREETELVAHAKTAPAYQAVAVWSWDLINVAAETGDMVATRLSVVDRKGNRSLSPVVQLSLATIGFDRDRYKSLYRRAELVPPLRALADSLLTNRQQISWHKK
jgi:hypothetical protein